MKLEAKFSSPSGASDRFRLPRYDRLFLRLGVAAAVVLLLFITTAGLAHYHKTSSSDACQVCHVAHAPLAQTQGFTGLAVPLFLEWTVSAPRQSLVLASFMHESSPRAPPLS